MQDTTAIIQTGIQTLGVLKYWPIIMAIFTAGGLVAFVRLSIKTLKEDVKKISDDLTSYKKAVKEEIESAFKNHEDQEKEKQKVSGEILEENRSKLEGLTNALVRIQENLEHVVSALPTMNDNIKDCFGRANEINNDLIAKIDRVKEDYVSEDHLKVVVDSLNDKIKDKN